MNLMITSPSLQCPYIVVVPKASGCLVPTWSSSKNPSRTNQIIVLGSVFLNPVRGINISIIRRNCSVNLYGGDMGDEPFEIRDGLVEEFNIYDEEMPAGSNMKNKGCCVIFEKNPTTSRYRENYLKFPSETDLLDPAMLGIQPDPPNWPERQSVINLSIEHKAKSFVLPLSLRLIKKKLQWEVRDLGDSSSSCCSFRNAFSSMVFIIMELQAYALKMMEVLWDEDMESIITKAQRDIRSSYIWIFQSVFFQTPNLMLYVMIFLANFSLYSGFHNATVAETLLSRPICSSRVIADEELMRTKIDIELWNSFMKEAKMGSLDEAGLGDHQVMERFVAPISVEVESDRFVDYSRTDFMYQVMLSQDPCNTLLLCNYARFLQLVAQDYDRAEELYKRALQVEPRPDAEVLSHYAAFLWTVRKELGRAEEMYLQAIAVEPGNPYFASRYASFLWSTSGEECRGSHMNASSRS